ncbi:hypothetical protein GT028_30400 [Streptomyces sp. SID2999]|uniref:hypothetical protein n=1 Tax=Streptomyces sp. SID2999 TaxID=2690258 RepID=UPI0013708EF2|nr:hypothetical protein [Streptomyces sp. SID2999]MYZ11636.1 hypothetical protein [Streptomyces sp. SID2999]
MSPRDFIETVRRVLDAQPLERERAADEIADCLSSYSAAQASALATVLAAAAVTEKDYSVMEAELHAILELMSTGHVVHIHVAQLQDLEIEGLPGEIQGYVRDLLEA